jgi:hypothetical protein
MGFPTPMVSKKLKGEQKWYTSPRLILFWSIGVIVTFVPVTDKPSERNRDRPPKNVPVVKW